MKAIFADPDSLSFWMGLVTMWTIGVHEQHAPQFDATLSSFCKKDEWRPAPGVKKYVVGRQFVFSRSTPPPLADAFQNFT